MKNSIFANIIIAGSLLIACSSTPKENEADESTIKTAKRADLSISLSKSPCYGVCPVYSMTLDNSVISLSATENTPLLGDYTTKAENDELDSLIEIIENDTDLQNGDTLVFDQYITDMPDCKMVINYAGKTKVIKYRLKLPKQIEYLDKYFTQILSEQFRWESK